MVSTMVDERFRLWARGRLWVWQPKKLNWWIATLFMIGAALFALGCALYLGGFEHEIILDSVFFTGSLFFTSAAYCQFHQSISASRIAFWAALSQFIGTLMFNMNTFDAFFDLDWIEQDFLVWAPNITGSILFQISGSLALWEIWGRGRRFHDINWWINFINFIGCVAFLVSAVLSFVVASPVSDLRVIWATVFTLTGAGCFFIGAFLMWPEMTLDKEEKSQETFQVS